MESDKIKVFVVDASEVWRKIIINHISTSPDIEVVGEINSGQGSILMLDEVNPDVVLLDVNAKERMPVADVVTQLKTINPDIHIILCADQANMANVVTAADKGINDFISKPYKRQLVIRSILECVNRTSEE